MKSVSFQVAGLRGRQVHEQKHGKCAARDEQMMCVGHTRVVCFVSKSLENGPSPLHSGVFASPCISRDRVY